MRFAVFACLPTHPGVFSITLAMTFKRCVEVIETWQRADETPVFC